MGTIYFILKNSIITIVIVCLLQLKFGDKTIEDRVMGFVRLTVAPKFLDTETTYITKKSMKLNASDLNGIRKKIYNNPVFKEVKNSAKELFLKEMTDVIKSTHERKLKDLEEITKED